MNWNNINLNDGYEIDQPIIDSLRFKDLLLEVSCNIKDSEISEESIMAQFEADLQNRIDSARGVMKANITNITNYAIKESNDH